MTFTPNPLGQPGQLPTVRLPRQADAQLYAQWAVRRIGRALALGIIGPIAFYLTGAIAGSNSDPVLWTFIVAGSACPVIALLSLCFAHAPD